MKKILTTLEVQDLANKLRQSRPSGHMYPIPRGGVCAAYALLAVDTKATIVDTPEEADFFIDDIIDSGSTIRKWATAYPNKPFCALIDKTKGMFENQWVVFPWEHDEEVDDTIVGTICNRLKEAGKPYFANDNIAEHIYPGEITTLQAEVERRAELLLRGLLIDVDNDHNSKDTAKRMARMYLNEIFAGRYNRPPELTDFPNAKGLDGLYITGPITVRSTCSHHFAPIIGECWIGVIPGATVVGLSKFNRLVNWLASRPQIQEELVVQIADAIEQHAKPLGLAVVIRASHSCMTWRGVKEPAKAKMTTSVMRGLFRHNPSARAEFTALLS